jgi:hypothetical protein
MSKKHRQRGFGKSHTNSSTFSSKPLIGKGCLLSYLDDVCTYILIISVSIKSDALSDSQMTVINMSRNVLSPQYFTGCIGRNFLLDLQYSNTAHQITPEGTSVCRKSASVRLSNLFLLSGSAVASILLRLIAVHQGASVREEES